MQVFQLIKNQYGSKKGFLKSLYYYFWGALHSENSVIPLNVKRVVFVCKGNICRSALADVYFRSKNDLECCSVGLDTTSGKKANQRIIDISKKYAVNMDSHRTTAIVDFKSKEGDLYVCMEPEHIGQLQKHVSSNSIILLGLLSDLSTSYIHDPYNANDEYNERCIKYILGAVNNLSDEISLKFSMIRNS